MCGRYLSTVYELILSPRPRVRLRPSPRRINYGCSHSHRLLFIDVYQIKKRELSFYAALRATRPPGGGRFLTDPSRVFEFNNWDNVVWDEEQESQAREKVEKNSKNTVSKEDQEKFENQADVYWDEFYMQHQNRFFKDRHWLFTEFPELAPLGVPVHIHEKVGIPTSSEIDPPSCDAALADQETGRMNAGNQETPSANEDSQTDGAIPSESESNEEYPGQHGHTRFLEVGCGVGNTVFPVLQTNNDPHLFVYCCDLSATAIQLVKDHPDFDPKRCHAFVCDVTKEEADVPFPENSLDIIVLIFVLSAVHPDKMQSTVNRLASYLKPGGLMVFRDYGRYDLAQLRFKDGKCLQDNFYVRGDGTRVYFFTQDELGDMFTKAGLVKEQNLIDRRLQVNRGRQLKMYRVWIQCKYRKPQA